MKNEKTAMVFQMDVMYSPSDSEVDHTNLFIEINEDIAKSMLEEVGGEELPFGFFAESTRAWQMQMGIAGPEGLATIVLAQRHKTYWLTIQFKGKVKREDAESVGRKFIKTAAECTYHQGATVHDTFSQKAAIA